MFIFRAFWTKFVVHTVLDDIKKFWHVFAVDYFDSELQSHIVAGQGEFNDLNVWAMGQANLNQQATFWANDISRVIGSLDERLHYGFDNEYWMRMLSKGYIFTHDNSFVGGRWRMHQDCKWKSRSVFFKYEWSLLSLRYGPKGLPDWPKSRRKIRATAAFCLIRMAQSKFLGSVKAWRYLILAVWYQPSVIFDKSMVVNNL